MASLSFWILLLLVSTILMFVAVGIIVLCVSYKYARLRQRATIARAQRALHTRTAHATHDATHDAPPLMASLASWPEWRNASAAEGVHVLDVPEMVQPPAYELLMNEGACAAAEGGILDGLPTYEQLFKDAEPNAALCTERLAGDHP